MKSMLLAAALCAGTVATPSMAAKSIALTQVGGQYTGSFTSNPNKGVFTDMFTFDVPSKGLVSAQVSTIGFTRASNIDFLYVLLNGVHLALSPTGPIENAFTSIPLGALKGTQTLTVHGKSGASASYSGTVNFSSAVPEPATWAMMIMGFGMVASAMRRRKSNVTTQVRFA